MNDGTDPETIPEPVRLRALAAAEGAIDRSLRADGYHLDYPARLELLDLALDDAVKVFEASLTQPLTVH